jgi:hypothetical protein
MAEPRGARNTAGIDGHLTRATPPMASLSRPTSTWTGPRGEQFLLVCGVRRYAAQEMHFG